MNQSKGRYKRYASFGPGGIKCRCCGPSPLHKKEVMRHAKKAMRRLLTNDVVIDED